MIKLRAHTGKVSMRQGTGSINMKQGTGLVSFRMRSTGEVVVPPVYQLDFTRDYNSQYINIIF